MKKKIYIIGNGFDMHHSLNTAYFKYKTYLKSINKRLVDRLDQLMEGGRSPEVLQLVDNLFDSAPQELKPVLLMYVTAFVCVDESVNRGEFEFVQRLLA